MKYQRRLRRQKFDTYMDRIILHSDLNNFFASAECLLNPELKESFVAVCGASEDRHGIVLAKNQKAKLCGVATGDTIFKARQKCPELVCVQPHFEEYRRFSKAVKKIYSEYTDEIESFGIDECWLDVTHSTALFGSGKTIAETIRERVKRETGLTVSVGVSFNKIFAKLCSDLKKPDAVTEVTRENFKEKLWCLPASSMLGVGRSTAAALERRGITTIGQLAAIPPEFLQNWLGKSGAVLSAYARGLDFEPVKMYNYFEDPKSVGRGVTCRADLVNESEVSQIILYLTREISATLRRSGYLAGSIALCLRTPDLCDREHSEKLASPTRSFSELHRSAVALFERSCRSLPLRAVTVRVGNIIRDSEPVRFDFFTDPLSSEKRERLEAAADSLCSRFGKNSVMPASLLGGNKLPHAFTETRFPKSHTL